MIKSYPLRALLLFCSLFVFTMTAHLESSRDKLNELVEKLDSGNDYYLMFQQANQHMATGMEIRAQGKLHIQKPDRFEWVYTSEPQNRIICDGHHIMMLLPDAQQAMVELSAEHAVIWSPLAILSPSNLNTYFRILLLEETNSASRYRLYPLRADQPYEYVEVIIHNAPDEKFFTLVIIDLVGSVNTLDFGAMTVLKESKLIVLPSIPKTYETTDFFGNPINFRIL